MGKTKVKCFKIHKSSSSSSSSSCSSSSSSSSSSCHKKKFKCASSSSSSSSQCCEYQCIGALPGFVIGSAGDGEGTSFTQGYVSYVTDALVQGNGLTGAYISSTAQVSCGTYYGAANGGVVEIVTAIPGTAAYGTGSFQITSQIADVTTGTSGTGFTGTLGANQALAFIPSTGINGFNFVYYPPCTNNIAPFVAGVTGSPNAYYFPNLPYDYNTNPCVCPGTNGNNYYYH